MVGRCEEPGRRRIGVGDSLDQHNRSLITPEMERRLGQARADVGAGQSKVTDFMAK